MGRLRRWGAQGVMNTPDHVNSISSRVVRCSFQGRRTAVLSEGSSTGACVGAVLDIIDMHLAEGRTFAGATVMADEVAVVLDHRVKDEAWDAVGSLVSALSAGPRVTVFRARGDESPEPVSTQAADFSRSAKAAHYLTLLQRLDDGPPQLLRTLQQQVDRDELKAYPMLTGHPEWSLRLEGLQVGRFRPDRGWLDVGKTSAAGVDGEARRVWLKALDGTQPTGRVTVTADDGSMSYAGSVLTSFADAWIGPRDGVVRQGQQNEHALESRVLRGDCKVAVGTGTLQRLADDSVTNWGSQFPTRWGRGTDPGTPARYLDALLRDGRVPWALEMKVQGGAGAAGYYRHAVGQAVLYRHFIRDAAPLEPWFSGNARHTGHDLDRTACRAAVVVPDLSGSPKWRSRLQAVCELVDVELVEVDAHHALLR